MDYVEWWLRRQSALFAAVTAGEAATGETKTEERALPLSPSGEAESKPGAEGQRTGGETAGKAAATAPTAAELTALLQFFRAHTAAGGDTPAVSAEKAEREAREETPASDVQTDFAPGVSVLRRRSTEKTERGGETYPSAAAEAEESAGDDGAETLSRRFERDARRYDGGFIFY